MQAREGPGPAQGGWRCRAATHTSKCSAFLQLRYTIKPRLSCFQFCGQRQQGSLLALAPCEMHTHRQAVCRPMQRHTHRRRASPAASNRSTGLRSRSMAEGRQKVTMPDSSDTAR